MIKWFIDRNNKIPLYLQLKDLIKYYISTGVIKDKDQLPGVNNLARDLGINFDTVRKAYKDLEKEGFLTIKRGMKTIVNLPKRPLHKGKTTRGLEWRIYLEPEKALRNVIERLLQEKKDVKKVRAFVNKVLNEIFKEHSRKFIIFTECNLLQVNEISELLQDYLGIIDVRPMLLNDLSAKLQENSFNKNELLAIVTTGFHLNEVQNMVRDKDIDTHLLITNMSPEARNELIKLGKNSRFGFICRDKESVPLYTDIIKAELGISLNLSSCILNERSEVQSILRSVDALLVSPPVYQEIKEIAPSGMPVYNVFDRVDPMSLRLIKDYVFRKFNRKI